MIYGDWIGRHGRSHPEKEALVEAATGRRWTYGQLSEDVMRLAVFLDREMNLKKGDRVACLSFNRAEYITLFFALSRLGAVLVPLNFRLAPEEFDYFINDAKPKAFFHDQDHTRIAKRLKEKSPELNLICLDESEQADICLPEALKDLADTPPDQVFLSPEDPQLIIYTSGTTGLPKGVILTHGMITWNALSTNLGWELRPEDSTILHAAMFYTAGWNVFTLPLFLSRGSNILVKSFEPELILKLIRDERISLFFGVPTMFQMLADSPMFNETDFSSLRFVVSGGAPLPGELRETFFKKKGLRLWEGYGLTEVGPNNFMANGGPGNLGTPMPFVDIKLVDENGREAKDCREGEILLSGPHMCQGYLNKPEATKEAIKDGWFHTGDLGKIDSKGHFSIVGRKKDMIISGGVNIYPAEIERIVENHPAVAGAAVIGVPDPKWGEVGKAVLELHPGQNLSLEDLNNYLNSKLGKFKLPKYLAVVRELPRTPASGKIQKFKLKEEHGLPDNG